MTSYYLDASVAVRILFGHAPAAAEWFDDATADDEDEVISSRLLRTELTRVLRREELPVALRDAITDHISFVPLTDVILAEAEAIVPHVKTLDAVHLASVVATGQDAVIVSHDAQMKEVAGILGYAVQDPVG